MTDDDDDFDEERAAAFIGKTILVGLTHIDGDGNEIDREQMHGVIVGATEQAIAVSLRGQRDGEDLYVPADYDDIEPAEPGVYELRSTGEMVENPDLIGIWTVLNPSADEDD